MHEIKIEIKWLWIKKFYRDVISTKMGELFALHGNKTLK